MDERVSAGAVAGIRIGAEIEVGDRVMVRGTAIEGVVAAKFLGPTSKRYVHEVGDGAFYADDLILLAPPLEAA